MPPRVSRESSPPGWTLKPVTASAVLDRQPALVTKDYPATGALSLPLTGNKLHNFGGESCGGALPDLFRISCDTGVPALGLHLGADALAGEAVGFGLRHTPPLGLPGVVPSPFPPPSLFASP